MEILQYTDDHQRFREDLRAFCEKEIVPYVDDWEKAHVVPRTVWQEMGKSGFLCTAVSREYGGVGGDFLYSVIALEEVSKTNHYGVDAFLHSDIVVPYIDSYGSREQKRKYLPGCVSGDVITAVAMTEPGAGSDLAAITTTAVENGDEIVINGVKTFISNGMLCDLVIVAAKDPAVQDPHKSLSLYLVEADRPGFKKGKPLDKLGVRSQDTNELFFNECRIPKNNCLGEKGTGFAKLMQKLQQERLLVAILAVSKAEFILEWVIGHFKKQRGSGLSPSGSQAVRFSLVEMATELKLGRTLSDKLIADHMQGKQIVAETSMAKYWNTEMANRVARRCLDLCGEFGGREECPIVRTFRDLRVTPIFAGTNEIMKEIVARSMNL